MPWVRHTNPYFSGPMPWRARWPLSRVLRYLVTFMAGVITGTALTVARVGKPDGALAISEVAPGISRVQRAGIVSPVEQVAVLASARDPDKTAVVLANRGTKPVATHPAWQAKRTGSGDE